MAPQLEHLGVHYCRQLKQLVRCIEGRTENDVLQQLHFSKSLTEFSVVDCPLLNDSSVHLDVKVARFKDVRLSVFKGWFSSQKHLRLCGTTKDHNVVPEANEDGLNGLTYLEVERCKDVECLVDTTTGNGPTSAFTHLEILRITECHGLETLCKGQHPQGFLKNLKELAVEKCFKLQVVLQMDDLPYRVDENQEKPLSTLQSLKLIYLPELTCIVKGSTHSFSLQSLKVVNIEKCCKLVSLFSPSLIQSLVMLEEVWISDCDALKTLIAELENNDGDTESNTSLPTPTLFLRKLKSLYISACPELQYALPITSANGLPALARISVSSCGELKQVFGTVQKQNGVEQDGIVRLGNLRDLRLCSLRNLSCFAPENYIFEAPPLERLEVDECPRFMKFAISQVDKQLHLTRAGLSSMPHSRNREDLRLDGWEVLESLVHATQEVIGLCMDFLENNKRLVVRGFEQLREIFRNDEENQAAPLLSNVEHLKLESLSELRWIVKVPTHSVSFQSLLVLEIDECHQLKYLFALSAIQTIRSLQQLKIANCNKLKSVFMELESSDGDKIESNSFYLPNLKTVDISWCRNAEHVFPLALAGGLPCLQKISLLAAENLCSFFAESNILEAPALEILKVSGCPQFRSFIVQKEANKSVSLKELYLRPDSCNMTNVPLGQMSPGFEHLTMGNFEQLFQLQGGYLLEYGANGVGFNRLTVWAHLVISA